MHVDWLIDWRPCQHANGYTDGRSQIKVHTDERTHVQSAQSSPTATHPSTNRARRYLTSDPSHQASIGHHRRPKREARVLIVCED